MISDNEEENLLGVEKDKDEIKKELSQMSFEDLQKLKEKLGTKIYNATVFGVKKIKKTSFKRQNKNRPQEMSAKKPVSRFQPVVPVKKKFFRDPRFDDLCGTYNEKAFKNSYNFLNEYRKNDLERLQNELESEDDPKQIEKIKFLIQRLENQLREVERKKKEEEKKKEEKDQIIDAIKTGKKPEFKKKSEKRITNLVTQYEDLKNSGKLQKHIQRIRKKKMHKDRIRLKNSESE